MKTRAMFTTLQAFANLAEAGAAEELRRFASILSSGKDEAVSARVRAIVRHCSGQSTHPARLRKSLVAIAEGLSGCGARKQAEDFHALLSLFGGSGTGAVDDFVERIAAAQAAASPAKSSTRREDRELDRALIGRLADELTNSAANADAFARVVEQLRNPKFSTATLSAIANQFLGKSKRYASRKAAIGDIVKRQELDARSLARGNALDRIGV